jgi:hypothetical protein
MKPIWSTRRLVLGTAAAMVLVSLASAGAADRRSYARGPGVAPAYVVAESQYGNGTVSGPVRPTSLGYQVRLPGGTWIYCRMSCTETLRVETVDFWESRNRTGSDRAFGLLDYFRGYPF